MSTISGNISKQSTATRPAGPPSVLATVLRLLAPETEAYAGRPGVHVKAFGFETDADPTGFFAISGPFSGSTVISFVSENRAFTLPVEVPPGGTVILRDVDLRRDGTARPSGTGFRVRGTIASVSCNPTPKALAVALGEQKIQVEIDGTTRIQVADAAAAKAACQGLGNHVGEQVRVEGDRSKEGTLLADRVDVGETADVAVKMPEVEFRGAVKGARCPEEIAVERTDGQSVDVRLDRLTHFEGALACDDLASASIRVQGALQKDGRVLARVIEAED
jgi:hypothetical protein